MINKWMVGVFALWLIAGSSAVAQTTMPTLRDSTVSLPFSELKAILEQARVEEAKAPVDYVFAPAKVAVTADRKTAKIVADIQVTLLNAKWMLIPVGSSAGVLSVTADGADAPIVSQSGSLFALVDGQKKKNVDLLVIREQGVMLDGATARIDLPLPPSPLSNVAVTIAAGNQEVNTSGGAAVKVTTDKDGTTVTGSFGGQVAASVSWGPKAAAGVVEALKLSATTLTDVAVDRGAIKYQVEVDYDISRAGTDQFRVQLPEGVEFDKATGADVQSAEVSGEGKDRAVMVHLNHAVSGSYKLQMDYEKTFSEKESPTVALASPLGVTANKGFIGVEVRGGYDVTPTVDGADRIDVKELPAALWDAAKSPLLFAYRYEKPELKMTLALVKHAEVSVLTAMCDTCEAATTVTADGKTITKLMYIMRNNLKQSLVVKLPEGAQMWSAFVDDKPVTPSKNAQGDVLVPLKKSENVDPDDEDSYRAKREQRRRGEGEVRQALRAKVIQEDTEVTDLKPYDVEIVYVTPTIKLEAKGDVNLALPQVDVPVGHMAWAVLLPNGLRVVDTAGTVSEVNTFSLPFTHFAEAGRNEGLAKAAQEAAQAQAQMDLQKAQETAASAKAAGVLPVRIEIPLTGGIYRFEKLLVVDEPLNVMLTYRKKAE